MLARRHGAIAWRALLAVAGSIAAYFAWKAAAIEYYAAEPESRAPSLIAQDPHVRLSRLVASNPQAVPYDGKAAERARQVARAVLARDPLEASALSTLALATVYDDPDQAARLFALAERVSRRDPTSQIWLAQLSAEAGDFAGLARRIDQLHRVRPAVANATIPALLPLLDQPRFRDAIKPYADQAWPLELVRQGADRGSSLKGAQALFAQLTRVQPEVYDSARAALLDALLAAGDVAGVRGATEPGLTRAGFGPSQATLDRGLGPLAWTLDTSPGAEVGLTGPGQIAVSLDAGRTSALMQRVTVLQPGSYALRFRIGAGPDAVLAELRWMLMCVKGNDSPVVWQQPIPKGSGRVYVAPVTVPAGCAVQRWRLQAVAPDGQRPSEFAVERIDLKLRR